MLSNNNDNHYALQQELFLARRANDIAMAFQYMQQPTLSFGATQQQQQRRRRQQQPPQQLPQFISFGNNTNSMFPYTTSPNPNADNVMAMINLLQYEKALQLNQLQQVESDIFKPVQLQTSVKMTSGEAIKNNLVSEDEKTEGEDEESSITSESLRSATDESSTSSSEVLSSTKGSTPAKKNASQTKHNKWLTTLEELKQYKAVHGDCVVPRGYAPNPRLASWVAEQRKQYKLLKDGRPSSITPERVAMLDEIEFAWNAQEAAWHRHMKDLKLFRDENDHCHVPLNHTKYPKLGLWVKEQRRHFTLMKQGKQSHMTKERINQLDAIGFCWDTHEATWLERLRELEDFRQKYGNCIVPTNFPENQKLGTWVHHQRRQYRKFKGGKPCHITAERIEALDRLGFVWHPRDKRDASSITRTTTSSACLRFDDSSSSSSDSEQDVSDLDLRPSKRQRSA